MIRRVSTAIALLALAVSLAIVSSAAAAKQSFPAVSATGAVGLENNGTPALVSFSAWATGPAMPGEEHQPASGFLQYKDASGLAFAVSVEHIHAHSATEVHFGGTITRASDPALVGMFAHSAAVDGGSPGSRGDQFGIVVSETGTCPCEHAEGMTLSPVITGNLTVRVPAL